MVFIVTVMDRQGDLRLFSLFNVKLETGFEILNNIVKHGDQIIQAKVLDNDKPMNLPVDAFDGKSCLPAIHNLMADWQQLLSGAVDSRLTNKLAPLDALKFQQICVMRTELAVTHFEQQLNQHRENSGNEPKPEITIDQLQTILNRCQMALANQRLQLMHLAKPPENDLSETGSL